MNITVKTLIPHTGANKWRVVGETYVLTRQYADIMKALKKVEIVGAATQGRDSIREAMPVLSGLADFAKKVDAFEALASETFAPLETMSAPADVEKPAHAPTSAEETDIEELKAEFFAAFGKNPHHKMSAETIRGKIDAAKAG